MPFKCSLAVLPQDFMGGRAPHRGAATPHNEPRTLLLPASRIHRYAHPRRMNKLNYITCFHIYNITYFFSFVKSNQCKGPWRGSLSSPRLPLVSLLSTPALPSQVSPHQMGTRFMVDIEPESLLSVLQGPTTYFSWYVTSCSFASLRSSDP
jgi:hypothetical protein